MSRPILGELPTKVDKFIKQTLLGSVRGLENALSNNQKNSLPAIDVSATQGKFLNLIARTARAKRVLEVGTLGGYSTIWFANALPADGKVITLEYEPKHAKVATENIKEAGVSDKVEVIVGAALDSLKELINKKTEPFDVVFIDADKPNSLNYVNLALKLSHVGTIIIVDNVIRRGELSNPDSSDENITPTRHMFEVLGKDDRLDSIAIQTVGEKSYDGFIYGFVVKPDTE